jgi:hypothetical protein
MKIILVIVICALRSTSLHLYAGAEQTYLISQSVSLKNIYACKDRCFALDKLFLFPMKVHLYSFSISERCGQS